MNAFGLGSLIGFLFCLSSARANVDIQHNQLLLDGKAQPAMLSAEVQYFRLRAGYGRNIPRAKVLAQWNLVLDEAKQAGIELITFYVPWDFHEYAAGKFDFDGSVDEDGDGQPDYPARDIKAFLNLIQEKGFRAVMVRPGPYISSEWGFLAIGAVPKWFYDGCPECRSRTADGQADRFMDVMNTKFLAATQNWFSAVYKQAFAAHIGPGKLIRFIQLDNETNYMWQDLDHADHAEPNLVRFRDWLKNQTPSLVLFNRKNGTHFKSWNDVQPPRNQWTQPQMARAWYAFMENQVHDYLFRLRGMWENLGVKKEQVFFTLAESFDAPKPGVGQGVQGILPDYRLKNEPGLMTLNAYPIGNQDVPYDQVMERTFKMDHNAKAADTAGDHYLNSKQEWLMGTEIEGCNMWPIPKHPVEAMKQVYLSAVGRGVKALTLFYFHHGYHFDNEWFLSRLKPLFHELKDSSDVYRKMKDEDLPDAFWDHLQKDVDKKIAFGFWALKGIWLGKIPMYGETNYANNLCFERDYKPKPYFKEVITRLGKTVIQANGELLGRAVDMADPVCLVHDGTSHRPSAKGPIDPITANSDWEPGLFGYLGQAGFNARIVHWNIPGQDTLADCKLVVFQDLDSHGPRFLDSLKLYLKGGGKVVSFLNPVVANGLGFKFTAQDLKLQRARLNWNTGPAFNLEMQGTAQAYRSSDSRCTDYLKSDLGTLGISCLLGKGEFVQISLPVYAQFNTGYFSHLDNLGPLAQLWDQMAPDIKPRVQLVPRVDKVIAWGRKDPEFEDYWITVRSSSLKKEQARVRIPELHAEADYQIKDVWTEQTQTLKGSRLVKEGLPLDLEKFETRAFRIRVVQ